MNVEIRRNKSIFLIIFFVVFAAIFQPNDIEIESLSKKKILTIIIIIKSLKKSYKSNEIQEADNHYRVLRKIIEKYVM